MDHEGIGGVAVGGDELFAVGRPVEGGDLGGGVGGVEARAGGGVPDVDGGVVGAAA